MTDTHIRFRHLQCFMSIAQHGTVGAAASALSITQPALSKTLRELERALGVTLFERHRRGMLLTRSGQVFLEHAATSVAALRTGIDRVRAVGGMQGRRVAVGALPTVAVRLMPLAVRRFKRDAPETVVRVSFGEHAELLDLLRLGELDLVVGRLARPEHMVGLSFEELYSEPLTIVVRKGHPLSRTRRNRLAGIGSCPCVLASQGTVIREEIDRFLIAHALPRPTNLVETTAVSFARSYTLLGDAVWIVARGIVAADLAEGLMVELPIRGRGMHGPVGIATRTGSELSQPADALVSVIRDVARAVRAEAS